MKWRIRSIEALVGKRRRCAGAAVAAGRPLGCNGGAFLRKILVAKASRSVMMFEIIKCLGFGFESVLRQTREAPRDTRDLKGQLGIFARPGIPAERRGEVGLPGGLACPQSFGRGKPGRLRAAATRGDCVAARVA